MAQSSELRTLAADVRAARSERGSSYALRRQQLLGLKNMLLERAPEFEQALLTDLAKNPVESEITEIGFVLAEIDHALRHLRSWMRARRSRSRRPICFRSAFIVSSDF